ncbi:hypothetical protein ACFPRL_22710 [Pseudoclavibacter helvolus]
MRRLRARVRAPVRARRQASAAPRGGSRCRASWGRARAPWSARSSAPARAPASAPGRSSAPGPWSVPA